MCARPPGGEIDRPRVRQKVRGRPDPIRVASHTYSRPSRSPTPRRARRGRRRARAARRRRRRRWQRDGAWRVRSAKRLLVCVRSSKTKVLGVASCEPAYGTMQRAREAGDHNNGEACVRRQTNATQLQVATRTTLSAAGATGGRGDPAVPLFQECRVVDDFASQRDRVATQMALSAAGAMAVCAVAIQQCLGCECPQVASWACSRRRAARDAPNEVQGRILTTFRRATLDTVNLPLHDLGR